MYVDREYISTIHPTREERGYAYSKVVVCHTLRICVEDQNARTTTHTEAYCPIFSPKSGYLGNDAYKICALLGITGRKSLRRLRVRREPCRLQVGMMK